MWETVYVYTVNSDGRPRSAISTITFPRQHREVSFCILVCFLPTKAYASGLKRKSVAFYFIECTISVVHRGTMKPRQEFPRLHC